MRFALITTVVAAALSAPLVAGATGPSMGQDQFLAAVQCEAYSSLPQFKHETAADYGQQMRLNGEAMRQPAETAARAQAEADAIYQHANTAAAPVLRQERNAACGAAGALLANRALAPDAV